MNILEERDENIERFCQDICKTGVFRGAIALKGLTFTNEDITDVSTKLSEKMYVIFSSYPVGKDERLDQKLRDLSTEVVQALCVQDEKTGKLSVLSDNALFFIDAIVMHHTNGEMKIGIEVEVPSDVDTYVFFKAVAEGDLAKIAEAIYRTPALILARNVEGKTALSMVIENRQKDVLNWLVERGIYFVPFRERYYQSNFLHALIKTAKSVEDFEAITFCVEAGMSFKSRGHNYNTPLYYLADKPVTKGLTALLDTLIRMGWDVEQPLDSEYRSLRSIAAGAENTQLVQLLFKLSSLQQFHNHILSLQQDALHNASPLYTAVKNASEAMTEENNKIIHQLLDKGSKLADDVLQSLSPLVYAVYAGDLDLFKKFVALGCPQNHTNYAGKTALAVAIELGREDFILPLLGLGVDISQPDEKGVTPLQQAVRSRNGAIVIKLLSKGKNTLHVEDKEVDRLLRIVMPEKIPAQEKIEIFETYKARLSDGTKRSLAIAAIVGGHNRILRWFFLQGVQCEKLFFSTALKKRQFSTLQLLLTAYPVDVEILKELMLDAVKNNHVDAVRLLHRQNLSLFPMDIYLGKAFKGYEKTGKGLEIIRFLLQQVTGLTTLYGLKDLDATNLAFPGESQATLKHLQYKHTDAAITKWETLLQVAQCPPAVIKFSEWEGWINILKSSVKAGHCRQKMQEEGIDVRHASETATMLQSIASILRKVRENHQKIWQAGLMEKLPGELVTQIINNGQTVKAPSGFWQKLELYIMETLREDPKDMANVRSLSTIVPLAVTWWKEAELKAAPKIEQVKTEPAPEVKATPDTSFVARLYSSSTCFQAYQSQVINEPTDKKLELIEKRRKISNKAEEVMFRTYGSDEKKVEAGEAVWKEKDSDNACRSRFGVPYNPYKPRFSDVDSQEALESNVRYYKGVTKKEDQKGAPIWGPGPSRGL